MGRKGKAILHFFVEVAVESAVASSESQISHLLLSFQKVEWIPCGLSSHVSLHKSFLFCKADTVFRSITSDSGFGELVFCLISRDSTMGRDPLQDYLSAFLKILEFLHETRKSIS